MPADTHCDPGVYLEASPSQMPINHPCFSTHDVCVSGRLDRQDAATGACTGKLSVHRTEAIADASVAQCITNSESEAQLLSA